MNRVLGGLRGIASTRETRKFATILFVLVMVHRSLQADEWRSPRLDRIPLLIEKTASWSSRDAAAMGSSEPVPAVYQDLPPDVMDAIADDLEMYEAFVVARVPAERLDKVKSLLAERQLLYTTDLPSEIELPFGRLQPGIPRASTGSAERDQPVPGLFVLQFAYPIRADWLSALRGCGLAIVAPLQNWALLVKAPSLSSVTRCSPSSRMTWVGSFRAGDRIADKFTLPADGEVTLQYLAGTPCSTKLAALPAGMEAHDEDGQPIDVRCRGVHGDFLRVRASQGSLAELVASDPNLLSVLPTGQAALSDERQGQIVAGNHNGTTLTGPGYRAWLQGRGLLSTLNAQTVATHDSGYDDGTFSGGADGLGDHHPDLESPDRLVVTATFPSTATHDGDACGHGTMVAGIIAGDVTTPNAAGAKDANGYLYGLGIAPTAKIAAARFGTSVGLSALGTEENAHHWSSARASIVNHSWNKFVDKPGPTGTLVSFSVPEYDSIAQALDQWTLDADFTTAGPQPVLEVVAASNYASASGAPSFDTVSSPGTAKNVLTVGATESDRPIALGPPATSRCAADATNVARIAGFSGRGKEFRPAGFPALLTNTRVKPDVVAPGVRVFSTVPYQYAPYSAATAVGCTPFSPVSSFYTYGSGTSFAAPVVSGMLALKRQSLINTGTANPSPSLLKAALIATSESLGGVAGNDHRPSPTYGWGRVSLSRLTDSRATFIHNEGAATAVTTGQERIFLRTLDSATSETRIVLVWSDVPSSLTSHSQEPLVNDLQLSVEVGGQGGPFVGNNFNEVVLGIDDGFSYRSVVGPFYNDSKNTVEAVFLPSGSLSAGAAITIHVLGTNVTSGPQRFSIYAYNVH